MKGRIPEICVIVSLIVGLLVGWFVTDALWESKHALAMAAWAEQKSEQERAGNELTQKVIKLERDANNHAAEIDKAYQQGVDDGKQALDDDIRRLHDGTDRMRDKFKCPRVTEQSSRLPSTGPATGINNEATQGGLQSADAEFLVRLGHEADDVVRQLTACQNLLISNNVKVQP